MRGLAFFDGFTLERIDGGAGASLRVRHGGHGSPVVLLHGHPRTHATWHMVASRLAPYHTVVCPDLRGYGESSKVEPYTKRAMAWDIVGVMRSLGHERFAVVGHDRGAYVATRLALEHQARVERLAVLEAMPLIERLERADWRFALSWWHWWFFGQLGKPAEAFINADPDAWYTATATRWVSRRMPTYDAHSAIRRWCTRCCRTTGQACAKIASMTKPTAPPAAESHAHFWSSHCSRTTPNSTTASTSQRSGTQGRPTFAVHGSTAVTTLPKRNPRSLPRSSSTFSAPTPATPERPTPHDSSSSLGGHSRTLAQASFVNPASITASRQRGPHDKRHEPPDNEDAGVNQERH
jgi:pimeloyl-ACP methyl ester carboxylesterase